MNKINLTFVVEDDEITSFLIPQILKQSGYFKETIAFRNGSPAFDYLQKLKENQRTLPNLILLDINMPVMDGWEFLEALQNVREFASIKVIMLTSSINERDMDQSKTYPNVMGYFTKPLDQKKIEEIIRIVF